MGQKHSNILYIPPNLGRVYLPICNINLFAFVHKQLSSEETVPQHLSSSLLSLQSSSAAITNCQFYWHYQSSHFFRYSLTLLIALISHLKQSHKEIKKENKKKTDTQSNDKRKRYCFPR